MRAAPVVFVLALLAAGCFPPRPASERPLSYRAPIPGWVRHDIDSTLSLLLPPELERQPRADTAFAPVFFASDSMRAVVWLGADADRELAYVSDYKRRAGPVDDSWLRNGNAGTHLYLRPTPGEWTHGQAVLFRPERKPGFFPSSEPPRLPDRAGAWYPSVTVGVQSNDSLTVDQVFDYIRLAFSPRAPSD